MCAFIVDVEGSAYLKEGTWMLLKSDESKVGLLSGGCLENDLTERANDILIHGQANLIQYDLSAEDDLSWGRGAGCNGVISVCTKVADAAFVHALTEVSKQFKEKQPILFIQSLHDLNKYCFFTKNGGRLGVWNLQADGLWEKCLQGKPPFSKYTRIKEINGEKAYIQFMWPKPDLYIFGAGEDARPLSALAAQAGYEVHVIDSRRNFCTKEYFPDAQYHFVGTFEQAMKEFTFTNMDSVVIMTHDFQKDREILEYLKNMPLCYIGVLGSKKRTARLMDGRIPKWLHSPVGLSIGAEGPFEIAISIIAEMVALRKEGLQC